MHSISSQDSVAQEVRRLQSSGKCVVFTNGCFDVLHPGHIELLTQAGRLGDALVIAINSDNSVRRLKESQARRRPRSLGLSAVSRRGSG